MFVQVLSGHGQGKEDCMSQQSFPRCDELKLNPSRLDKCSEKEVNNRHNREDAEMFHDI